MKINFKKKKSNLFPQSVDDWRLLLLLTIGAYLGNYFHLHLFFGVHFLFGSIAIWLIVWRYGLPWGILASLIASSQTFFLWGHAYAIIIFTLEITIVSFFWRRQNSNLVILDGLYWLIVGMPLIWIFYRGAMSISNISTLLILLKQPVNGLFNSLIASLIINFIPQFSKNLKFRKSQNSLSLRQTLFNVILAFMFFPALIVMIWNGQEVFKQIETEISNHVIYNIVTITHLVQQWHHTYDIALTETVQDINQSQLDYFQEFKLLLKTFPDFQSIISIQPNNLEEISFSSKGLVIKSQQHSQDYNCEIESGSLIDNLIYFKTPIISEANSSSCFLGKVTSKELNKLIQPVSNITNVQISLLDSHNQIIVSNQSLENPVNFESGTQQSVNGQIYQWFPEEKGLPVMIKWSKSLYWQEDNINSEIPWKLRVLIPAKIYIHTLQKRYIINLALMLGLSFLALIISWLISRGLVTPLSDLAKITNNLPEKLFANLANESNRDKLKLNLHQGSVIELDALINNFNTMSNSLSQKVQEIYQINQTLAQKTTQLTKANEENTRLNEKLKAENLRMGAELDVARQIQQMILPKLAELKAIEGIDLAGFMEPADEVGGDYYDVLHTDGVVTMGIGDVTGHGLESGILMLMTQTAVRTLQEIKESDPVRFLDTLNRTLYQNVQRMDSDKNLTLAILNYSEGRVSISGQHEETLVVRAGGQIERIDTMDLGLPIGMTDDIADFIDHTFVELNSGDGVVLYTDGIPEAFDLNKKQYGMERLCEVISHNWQYSAQEIKQAVIDDVRKFIGEQKVFDDITLVILKQQ